MATRTKSLDSFFYGSWIGNRTMMFKICDYLIVKQHSHKLIEQCSAPGSLDTSLSHAAGLIEIAACDA